MPDSQTKAATLLHWLMPDTFAWVMLAVAAVVLWLWISIIITYTTAYDVDLDSDDPWEPAPGDRDFSPVARHLAGDAGELPVACRLAARPPPPFPARGD